MSVTRAIRIGLLLTVLCTLVYVALRVRSSSHRDAPRAVTPSVPKQATTGQRALSRTGIEVTWRGVQPVTVWLIPSSVRPQGAKPVPPLDLGSQSTVKADVSAGNYALLITRLHGDPDLDANALIPALPVGIEQ